MIDISAKSHLYQSTVEFYLLLHFHVISSKPEETCFVYDMPSHKDRVWLTVKNIDPKLASNGPLPEIKLDRGIKALALKINEDQADDDQSIAEGSFLIRLESTHFSDIKTNLDEIKYPYTSSEYSNESNTQIKNSCIFLKDPNGNPISIHRVESSSAHHVRIASASHNSYASNGTWIQSGSKRKIAILTSGGDSPGMNAALRSIARIALVRGCQPYAVLDGYQGLVQGGSKIKRLFWDDLQGILDQGGTLIGTARSKEFRTKEGRKAAALNLAQNGIDALAVIGGDGSLTGANTLRTEWPGLLQELSSEGLISKDQAKKASLLAIVGLVGSIDNDMATTDITIGAITSVHRICEAVDSISSTAYSHNRAFVVEVMGRNCGWLALMAAISCGADWLFIPEKPPSEGWKEEMCSLLHHHRDMGKRKSIIIVAEGAIDKNLQPIKAEDIKDLISSKLQIDTRVTTLGHVQRGGSPVALDRFLATVQGVKAVDTIISYDENKGPQLIGFTENKVTSTPLMEAVNLTREVSERIKSKEFERVFQLRDPEFKAAFKTFYSTLGTRSQTLAPENKRLRVAIIHTGAPAGGMNAATKAVVRFSLNRGHIPYVVHNGFSGLISGDIRPIDWMDVESWTVLGGSQLGTNRSQPSDDIGLCAYQLQKNNIQSLIVIGGFEAYTAVLSLAEARKIYPAFCIPTVLIPATISNNVPGTEISLGADTALNVIVEACDKIKQSALSSRKRVFVVEVQGGRCGYLATLGGLASGSTCAYIPEEPLNLNVIGADAAHLVRQFTKGENQGRVIIRNEEASETYSTEVISAIFRDEGKGVFDSRSSILGHIQQGGAPSPMDRVRANRFAVCAMNFIEEKAFPSIDKHLSQLKPQANMTDNQWSPVLESKIIDVRGIINQINDHASFSTRISAMASGVYTPENDSTVVVGIHQGTSTRMIPIEDLISQTDFKNRRPTTAWWLDLNRLIRILAKYGYQGDDQTA